MSKFDEETELKMKRFQKNLCLIRKAVGWSEEEFGNKIGVSRQTISSLERIKDDGTFNASLSKTQYIAMRAVLNDEIIKSRNTTEDTDLLVCLLEVIIDNPDKYSEQQKNDIFAKANMLTPAIITKTNSRKEVSNEFKNILKTVGIAVGAIVAAAGIGYFFKGDKK